MALIGAWYAAMVALVVWHAAVPAIVSVAALAVLGAQFLSIQHEVIHGHPTPWQGANVALVAAPWSLWCPYPEYRASHLAHHAAPLTTPGVDPESFYVSAAQWRAAGPVRRAAWRANRTLLGRFTVGVVLVLEATLIGAAKSLRTPGSRLIWPIHSLAVAAVVWIVCGLGGLPWWEYVVGFAYGGLVLTLLRSFAEHRFTGDPERATAVVRSNPAMSLLFLNNNLHVTHHAAPGAAWYRLPALHRQLGADDTARDGAGWYRGYAALARRHGVRAFDQPVHAAAE